MRHITCLLSLCIIFFSCQKEIIPEHNNASAAYFPNSVGNYWRYKYIDSVTATTQMVDVHITGNIVLPGGQNAAIWTYTFAGHIDTNYVFQVGDTVNIMDQDLTIQNIYIIPLQLNNIWKTKPGYQFDSVLVIDKATYLLNGHYFENSFLLRRNGHLPNQYWSSNEWLCPNIGMLTKRDRSFFTISNEPKSAYWELVSYDLK